MDEIQNAQIRIQDAELQRKIQKLKGARGKLQQEQIRLDWQYQREKRRASESAGMEWKGKQRNDIRSCENERYLQEYRKYVEGINDMLDEIDSQCVRLERQRQSLRVE